MRVIFSHLALMLTFIGAFAFSAVALAATDTLDDVPDEYIIEADQFYDSCQRNYSMKQYYNCECMSVAYLDERIAQGPLTPPSQIELSISSQCRDAVGAAGPTYNQCLSKANRFEPGTDPEKYCECVANSYVKLIDTYKPVIDSRSIVAFGVEAYSQCGNVR